MSFLLYLLAFIAPLRSTASIFYFTDFKVLFVRLIIAVFAMVFFGRLIFQKTFLQTVKTRARFLFRNPITISLGVYFLFYLLSAILAENKFLAFFSTYENAEGVVGMVFFLALFIFLSLVFQKKEWLRFFKFSLLSTIIVFAYQLVDFFHGVVRPYSLLGNAHFLAEFFLFSLAACAIIYFENLDDNHDFWLILSPIAGIMALVGIVMSEDRAVLIGIVTGIFAALLYLVFLGPKLGLLKRRVSFFVLTSLIIFGGMFLATKNASFWQKVPGIKRVAQISFSGSDNTTSARIIGAQTALRSVNPAHEGYKKLFFGWGPENFIVAWYKNLDPKTYFVIQASFDRAHNVLLDQLVMYGVFGLLAFLTFWFFVFRALFSKRINNIGLSDGSRIALIFFGVSYFVQNLFGFDSTASYVTFFVFLGFVMYLLSQNHQEAVDSRKSKNWLLIALFGLLPVFLSVAVVFWTVVPYFQIKNYLNKIEAGKINEVAQSQFIFYPYTYAQFFIRKDFLIHAENLPANASTLPYLQKAVQLMEELLPHENYNPFYYVFLARGYAGEADITRDPSFSDKAEQTFKKAISLSSNSQELYFSYGKFLLESSRVPEGLEIMQKAYDLDPRVPYSNFYYGLAQAVADEQYYPEAFSHLELSFTDENFIVNLSEEDLTSLVRAYKTILYYYYTKQDTDHVLAIARRLAPLDTAYTAEYNQIIDAITRTGKIPTIQFGN